MINLGKKIVAEVDAVPKLKTITFKQRKGTPSAPSLKIIANL
jgi:hypothetical protein